MGTVGGNGFWEKIYLARERDEIVGVVIYDDLMENLVTDLVEL